MIVSVSDDEYVHWDLLVKRHLCTGFVRWCVSVLLKYDFLSQNVDTF